MDNNEVKTAVETLGKTFESFKETNDERLKQIEAKGSSDPITEEKLSKIIKKRFFVTGLKDELLGEKLILVIENTNKNVISSAVEKSLLIKIQNLTSLSKFEKPKEIYFVKHFIETKTGKVQRTQTLQKIFTK